MAEGISLNNSWRVAMAAAALVCTSLLFVWLTFYGTPTNALHSWAQSASLTVSVGILACGLGFKPLADALTTMLKR